MTFCIGICVRDGIVVLSDTRIVRGSQISVKAKLSTLANGEHSAVLMTSGLRSVRDKVALRLQDELDARPSRRMHELATAYGDQLRAVKAEDGESLAESGLVFDSHAIIGGQLVGDDRPTLLHVYPEGNWVESTVDEPYFVIGRNSYGKPILDRLLRHDTPLVQALSLAHLAFDATRTSASDVDYPIDVAVLGRGASRFATRRFTEDRLASHHQTWNDHLREALDALPTEWTDDLVASATSAAFPIAAARESRAG